jgi:endogenous inhibitor of DNA gyrase (YacG/DUF329 family)
MPSFICPVCDAPVDPDSKAIPFCSERCRQIDLGRWLGERYSFPAPKRREPREQNAEQEDGDD